MKFTADGVREISFKYDRETQKILREDWRNYVSKIKACPRNKFSGRGIVFTAGGISYVTCAWVSISILRDSGCQLPIEIWHKGTEISEAIMEKFRHLNVEFRNFYELGEVTLAGYMLKPLAIIGSRFAEIIFMDADNICVKDPEYLFDTKMYLQCGSIFWPDFWHTSRKNSIWPIIGTRRYDLPEQESGQIVMNKLKCWRELQLCLYLNQMSNYYYKLILGDKDTFRFAWLALNTDFHMIETMVGTCGRLVNGKFYGTTMVQHDPEGEIIFLHRNLLKWDVTNEDELVWEVIKRFNQDPIEKKIHYGSHPPAGLSMDITGDVNVIDFKSVLGNLELKCHKYLSEWRASPDYVAFFHYLHVIKNRLQ